MKSPAKISVFMLFTLLYLSVSAQIETTIFNESGRLRPEKMPFFTNRQLVVNQDNSYSFKNSDTKQTNTLYFCTYNYETGEIDLNMRAINTGDAYPKNKVTHNILYDIYEYYRLKKGIRNFYIIVGGYGKSFDKQVHGYMQRLKSQYGDSLFQKALVSVFAWGTQDKAYRYYNALRVSERGAADFAIFQHMLDEFMSDSVYFETHPKDLTISILFSSMANELFRSYIVEREKQNIPLLKTYNSIIFVGSVAPRNVFEEGQPFRHLDQLTDTVRLVVNSKDILLKMSSLAHLKNRIGNKGPTNPDNLPGFVTVSDIKGIITKEDMKRMGHDYVLTNPIFQDALLESIQRNIESKNED